RSPLPLLTVEDYLNAEAKSPTRHEYVGGYLFAMAGASEEHNIIVVNISSLLRPHLRGSSCRVFVSDMKVKVQDDIFYYPDLLSFKEKPGGIQAGFKTIFSIILTCWSLVTPKIITDISKPNLV
ncbi:Uma2 family endonuclease, partial [Planktothrix sp.]